MGREKRRARSAARQLPETGRGSIQSDVQGSYTGAAADGGSPVQDADDL